MKKFVLLVFVLMISICLYAQNKPVIVDPVYKLPVKEKLNYRVYYKLSAFWIYGASVTFFTDTITYENKRAYKLQVDAFTREKYRWIYSLEDHYTSITDCKTFLPLRFEEHNIEKKVNYDYTYVFDWENEIINMTLKQSEKPDRNIVEKLPDFITDTYSAVHYIRLWDYNEYTPGDTIEFQTIVDGKIFKQEVIYLGKESLKDNEGKMIKTFELQAIIKNSTFFIEKKGNKVWVANNKERWILQVDANIIIGRIIAFIDTPGIPSH